MRVNRAQGDEDPPGRRDVLSLPGSDFPDFPYSALFPNKGRCKLAYNLKCFCNLMAEIPLSVC
jgi:hypothetical protein